MAEPDDTKGPPFTDAITISSPKNNDTVKPSFQSIGTFMNVAGVTEVWCKIDGGAKVRATINSPRAGVWLVSLSASVGTHNLVAERYVSGVLSGSAKTDPFFVKDSPGVAIEMMGGAPSEQGYSGLSGDRVDGTNEAGRTVTARLIPYPTGGPALPEPVQVVVPNTGTTWYCTLSGAAVGRYEYVVTGTDNSKPEPVVTARIGEVEIT